jgi:hypothetical protein
MSSLPAATKTTADPKQKPGRASPGIENLVREAFNDVALLIGAVAAIHQVEDDLVWTVMKRLDRIRIRLLRDLKGVSRPEDFDPQPMPTPRVHAAVDEFLARNLAGAGE